MQFKELDAEITNYGGKSLSSFYWSLYSIMEPNTNCSRHLPRKLGLGAKQFWLYAKRLFECGLIDIRIIDSNKTVISFNPRAELPLKRVRNWPLKS
ncbi:hypothetical protein [Desulfolucanica intricata]|uniref:hypothetical protein n=1 Tax=Desulfolucanica intricata TaxID=1285191 RepID=UPI0008295990|nr:hypothetical protein [Desulfolucanica intricata]